MTDKELERGFNLTLRNAKELIEEANGLAIFERYSRAYSLYQLAIEEIGKCIIIYVAILDYYMGITVNEKYLRDKGFFNHKEKTKASLKSELLVISLFEKSTGKKTNLSQDVIEDSENIDQINEKKNQSLYVGLKEDNFLSPNFMINKNMVDEIAYKACVRWKGAEPLMLPLKKMKFLAEEIKANYI
ncbi:hypothetical protein FACS189416_5330 [Bacteroidia bacterium]|nr:hypothetical protein FACS189416_5330 [Bacteroidia bacterium]